MYLSSVSYKYSYIKIIQLAGFLMFSFLLAEMIDNFRNWTPPGSTFIHSIKIIFGGQLSSFSM